MIISLTFLLLDLTHQREVRANDSAIAAHAGRTT
jgi:hypothetical protein